jgi:intracellular multiplication protein IcmE
MMKFNFKLSKLLGEGGRSRIFMLIVAFLLIAIVVVIIMKVMQPSETAASGRSQVTGGAKSARSTQGGKVSAQYAKLIQEANRRALERAKIKGTSAIPTVVNYGGGTPQVEGSEGCGQCCGACKPGSCGPSVEDMLDALVRTSKISAAIAQLVSSAVEAKPLPSMFSRSLQDAITSNNITADQARKLYSTYKCHFEQAQLKKAAILIDQLIKSGKLSLHIANKLLQMQKEGASPKAYRRYLQRMVRAGRISPSTASTLYNAYKKSWDEREAARAKAQLDQLVKAGKLSKQDAATLAALQRAGVSIATYKAALDRLVREGKISPAEARRLLEQYKRAKGLGKEDEKANLVDSMVADGVLSTSDAALLNTLKNRGVSASDYAQKLKELVAQGKISPSQAALLMSAYQKTLTDKSKQAASDLITDRQQREALTRQKRISVAESRARLAQETKDVNKTATKMKTQFGQLIRAWRINPQEVREGEASLKKKGKAKTAGKQAGDASIKKGKERKRDAVPPAIKAGEILYAVLDTAVDSDYSQSPVMATVASGEFSGATLIGKVQKVKDGARVMLSFSLLTKKEWKRSVKVQAFAIDPDTARAALATSVNYHYLVRYGALFASAFMQGFSQAIQSSGSSTSTSAFGVQTSSIPKLNPTQKFLVALGKVGQESSQKTKKLVQTPPTVRVKAGVALGILFTKDLMETGELGK